MAIIKTELTRVFVYNGMKLADPGTHKRPEEVAKLYAPQYPELLNCVVEGPVTKAGVCTYTFRRAAGAKG